MKEWGLRRLRIIRAVTAALAVAVTAPALADTSCSVSTEWQPYYHLELTVPATFCKEKRRDASCRGFPKPAAIQLHGLWVDYAAGSGDRFPEGSCTETGCRTGADFCRLPDVPALYRTDAWKKKQGYFAGTEKCLERHEWVKHGSCSPMDPATWITWSLDTTEAIVTGLALPVDKPLSRTEFDAAVAARLPELVGAFRLTCKGGLLVSLSVDYDWGPEPGAPRKPRSGKTRFGRCGDGFVIPSRP